jgi:hypothetical protein
VGLEAAVGTEEVAGALAVLLEVGVEDNQSCFTKF